MNSENFHEYVKNPSMLHQVSYQELKSLVLQYPYSPNLRYLLLLKSLFDQSKDFDRNQVLASLSSPDRKKLRQLTKQYSRLREIQENYALNEDFLELKDLSVLENLIAEPTDEEAGPSREPNFVEALVPPSPSTTSLLEDLEEMEEDGGHGFPTGIFEQIDDWEATPIGTEALAGREEPLPDLESLLEDEPTVSPQAPPLEELAQDEQDEQGSAEIELDASAEAPTSDSDIPLEITNEPAPQPLPKPRSSFHSWLRQLNPPQAGLLKTDLKDIALNNRQPHHPEEEKEDAAKQMAEQSVEEDNEIASETLALLLEKQRHYSKAISMYKRLILKYPEKSGLFAAKIEELNKKN